MSASSPTREKPSLLRYLRRETTTGLFLPEVDGLRFIAILSVVLYHVFMLCSIKVHGVDEATVRPVFETYLGNGGRGVLLFFCISGFILGLPFARHRFAEGPPVRLKAYFARRLTRLEPPYLLNLLLRFPFAIAAHDLTAAQALPHLLASVFYVHTLVYGKMPAIHPPSWSLEVEVQFYILAPFVATALYRLGAASRRIGLLAMVVVATTLQWRLGFAEGADGATRASFSILNYAQFFLAGLLAADLFHSLAPRAEGGDRRLDLLGALSVVAFFAVPNPFARFLLPFLGFATLWSALRSRTFKAWLSKPFVYIVGGMCYSLYLTHSIVLQGVLAILMKLMPARSFATTYAVAAGLALPLVLVVGAAFYALIERPCMDKNWPAKLRARLFPGRAAA